MLKSNSYSERELLDLCSLVSNEDKWHTKIKQKLQRNAENRKIINGYRNGRRKAQKTEVFRENRKGWHLCKMNAKLDRKPM